MVEDKVSNGNGANKPLSGLLVLLTALATFVALVGNYIKPLQQQVSQVENRIELVYDRALQSDHLEEITSLSERLKAIDKDTEAVKAVEVLHNDRTKARLEKLEKWHEETHIMISALGEHIARLQAGDKYHDEMHEVYKLYYQTLIAGKHPPGE